MPSRQVSVQQPRGRRQPQRCVGWQSVTRALQVGEAGGREAEASGAGSGGFPSAAELTAHHHSIPHFRRHLGCLQRALVPSQVDPQLLVAARAHHPPHGPHLHQLMRRRNRRRFLVAAVAAHCCQAGVGLTAHGVQERQGAFVAQQHHLPRLQVRRAGKREGREV